MVVEEWERSRDPDDCVWNWDREESVTTLSEGDVNWLFFLSTLEMKVSMHFSHELTHSLALRARSKIK